ncbi:MAG: hypothetical protein ACREK7_05585 [Gemmatimonadota bacterium]
MKVKVITLRNLSPELARRISDRADRTGKSFARTVIHLLEERLGLTGSDGEKRLHHDLDHLAGRWSPEVGIEFDRTLSDQRGIDPELWR